MVAERPATGDPGGVSVAGVGMLGGADGSPGCGGAFGRCGWRRCGRRQLRVPGSRSRFGLWPRRWLVYLVYNTISNLLTQAEQVACFRNAARHLTAGGRFVIELWVPELRALPPGQQATVFCSQPGYIGVDSYDVLHQRVVSHHFRFGEGEQAQLFRSPHRYIWPAELDLMAQLAGFELESRCGDWSGAAFIAESRSHVSVYRFPS
ncbi:MAG: hypothetical protein K2Q25_14600 [Mycobacteriaceae bacterium]|nr:hypothetical protein [Mycobacteriaceae bacterium]